MGYRAGLVLDLFGGSGSTLIAADKTGRRARICELDPIYCDRIIGCGIQSSVTCTISTLGRSFW